MLCPVAPGDARLGDGFCEDALNIRACGYDGGDCCSSTCKQSQIQGSCALSRMNCRDKAASKDVVPPVILAPGNTTIPVSLLANASDPGRDMQASAYDNFPCFVPHIETSDQVTLAGNADCSSKVSYVLTRTYTARDRAGNVGQATAILTVLDDEPPMLLNTPQPPQTVMDSTFVRGGGMANSTRVSPGLSLGSKQRLPSPRVACSVQIASDGQV